MTSVTDYRYIDTPASLAMLCEELAASAWLAVDTEFQRDKTYYPQLCLVQVANETLIACIDPMALSDLAPLLALLADKAITKVFHAGRQDLEIFYHLLGHVLVPVFDTQVAAPLLGFPEQLGYASLVERMLKIHLAKAYTRADWTQRPLPEGQLQYAADDVRHLVTLYPRLRQQLSRLGRLEWLDDEFNHLCDPALYEQSPARAWLRIGGAERLEGPRLSVLQALAAWRETTARAENVPRGWVLRDETVVDLAVLSPTSRDALHSLRGITERSLRRYGETIVHLVREARNKAPEPRTLERRAPRLGVREEALVDCLNAIIRLRAQEQDLNAGVIATRKELERLVAGERDLPLCSGWRANFVWHDIEAFLAGKAQLQVGAEGVILQATIA